MRTLPDYLRKGLKLVIVGSNPGERSAQVGHYYAGRTNHFWELLYQGGIVPEPLEYEDDVRMMSQFGIGLTDLVKRPTRGMEDLKREEFAEGRVLLAHKLEANQPKVIAFCGKMVYEKFAQRECKLGLQEEKLYGGHVFVLPSTSGQNAIAPAVRKRYFRQLGKFLEKLSDRA
jgi:TDG/mug DNA glycosylase family protein